ncbi:MAG: Farnesyl diphosphate synthase [Firmicutes bacterium ADurb.Bin193]|nr:MAG: Farnesyl diphosphate synthase [Firmicutes bacterium ADurb.Bin193]
MNFTDELSKKTQTAERWLKRLSPNGEGYHKTIFEVVNYSLEAGGKRIRPVLALGVCEMLGGREEDVMPLACAVEFIHTSSLIHDDLPCMDDDDLRRGKPTSHIRFGEALALLGGDALLFYAFETIANAGLPADTALEAVKILASASGISGMVGGQVIDIKGADSYDELISLYKMKTGALLEASVKLGVLAAGNTDPKVRDALDAYAANLGIAFQIKDDILDVEGEEKVIGKKTGRDAAIGKKNFVNSLGIDGARLASVEYANNAKNALQMFGDKSKFLVSLADYLIFRNK